MDCPTIPARPIRGMPIDVTLWATPFLLTNHIPHFGSDSAVWRRIAIVNWDFQISEKDKSRTFVKDVLEPEYEGIFNWIVKGAQIYMENGLDVPQSVVMETAKEKQIQDRVDVFIKECCIPDPEGKVVMTTFRAAFHNWCTQHGNDGVARKSTQTLNKELVRLGWRVENDTRGNNKLSVFGFNLDDKNQIGVVLKRVV